MTEVNEVSLDISKTIKELKEFLKNNLPFFYERLDRFELEYKKNFTDIIIRTRADALVWALMGGPLILYALGKNGSAIVELHGILERFFLRDTINHIVLSKYRDNSVKFFERHTLQDFVNILSNIGLFNKEDVKFIRKINSIRNGFTHLNPKIISNKILSGKEISFLDIDYVMRDFDCIPIIIDSIKILLKLSSTYAR